jgi:hypothetical protein
MSNARFSILQARAVKDKRVSDAQFRTLAALGMYANEAGWCFPSLTTLGNDLSKSKQAVGRDTIALRKLGYLEVTPRYDRDTGARRSSLYRLKFDLPPVNVDDATPSTPEVDINDPVNDPINSSKSKRQKKGDYVDALIFYGNQAKDQQADKVEELIQELERGLRVNIARTTRNQQVAKRILKDARPVARFLAWVNAEEWRATHTYLYADLEKVWRDFPQAFPAVNSNPDGKRATSFYG